MYVSKTPAVVKALYSSLVWNMPRTAQEVYLTFDDGPHPHITPQVLTLLAQHGAKASFFCVGENVARYPDVFNRIRHEGHSIGNHTHNHVNGWQTPAFAYLRNVMQCQQLTGTGLFRPPYGRISRQQARALNTRFKIIMWDVLSADFDPAVSPEQCLQNVTGNVQPGSIIVFHDSEKAAANMLYALPRLLGFLKEKNLACVAL